MSKPRKSFLLHFDSLGILDKLTKEQAGELFIACRDYNLGKELELDPILELVFFSFKSQFDRDMEKYQNIVDRNKSNGSRGGRPEKPKEPKKPTGLTGNPKKARKADSVNDSDSDNDSDSKKEISKTLVAKARRFTPPTDIETVAYFESKGSNSVEAEKFWLFYDSKDWHVGKNKMKKWQSAASGWISRNKTDPKTADILTISDNSNWEDGINDIF